MKPRTSLVALFASIILIGSPAAEATVINGDINSDTTWTTFGNDYVLQQDVTVSSSAALTVTAGTTIVASPSDGSAGGISTSKVEFVVNGTVNLYSSDTNPIQFIPQSGQLNSSWYGVRVGSGGTINLSQGTTTLGGDLHLAPGSTLSVNGIGALSVNGSMYLGGAFQIDSNALSVAVGSTIEVLNLSGTQPISGTFSGLSEGGTTNSRFITWQASYVGGTGNDFALRAISVDIPVPENGGGGGGSGLPCSASGAGTTLSSSISGFTTLNCAGSPYRLTGDVSVPNGVTLSITPGVFVLPNSSDLLATGRDPTKIEMDVYGNLLLQAVDGAPVVLGPAESGIDGWTGVVIGPGGNLEAIGASFINGDIRFENGSVFTSGILDSSEYGALGVAGDAYLSGNLALLFDEGYLPTVGDMFDLVNVVSGHSLYGEFANIGDGDILDFGNFSLEISYKGGDGNDVVATVIGEGNQIPEPGSQSLIMLGSILLLITTRSASLATLFVRTHRLIAR